jgi:hypothetical protein
MSSRLLRTRRAMRVATVVSAALAPATLRAQRWTYVGSTQLATGRYVFADRTTSLYFANGVLLERGRWRGSISVPIVAQVGTRVQYVAGGMVPSGGMHDDGGRSGRGMGGGMMSPDGDSAHGEVALGDPIARVEVGLQRDRSGAPTVRLTGVVKAPLAGGESGFGSGAWDYGGGVSLARSVAGAYVFADATYWVIGDAPTIRLANTVSYAAGVGRPLPGGRFAVLASLTGTTRVVSGIPAPVQVGGGVSYLSPSGKGVSVSALGGLSRSAPDLSVGLGWYIPLSR